MSKGDNSSYYRLEIEYDGRPFSGWQKQENANTVQSELENALRVLLGSKRVTDSGVKKEPTFLLTASGRTDAGVSARTQTLSLTLSEPISVPEWELKRSLNGLTPREISIHRLERCLESFNARRAPHLKCYSYKLVLGNVPSAILGEKGWVVGELPGFCTMLNAAEAIVGTHDFSSFRASDCCANTCTRTILLSQFTRVSDRVLEYRIHGNGFLKQMVRMLVGTLVEIGRQKLPANSIEDLLESPGFAKASLTAPAPPLSLEWVVYK